MEERIKNITHFYERHSTLPEKVENTKESISNSVLSGDIDILESTKKMDKLAREVVIGVGKEILTEFHLDTEKPPFAIFFFGSPSRNLMLPNSDLDVGLVFTENCTEEIKVALREKISSLPFDKVDIASWSTLDAMRKENCPDMIEYNKAVGAKFIVGNPDIAQQHIQMIRNNDTEYDKIKRFITEYGLFHKYDYLSKKTEQGFNLKYDFGASRDVIFLDWYSLLKGNQQELGDSRPFFVNGLNTLVDEGTISSENRTDLLRHIELVLLVKFTLLSKFRKNNNKMLIHLSSFSLHEAYKEAGEAFRKLGIKNGEELIAAYYDAKLALHDLVERMYTKICVANPELPEIWKMAEKKSIFDEDVRRVLDAKTWYNLVPFAICSKSPEILDFLVDSIHDLPGYEYILRIASENKFLKDETKKTLLRSRLADRFKEKLTVTEDI